MLVYLDTDAFSHLLAAEGNPAAVALYFNRRHASLIASEQLLEELLVTSNIDLRESLAMALHALLKDGGQVLAPVNHQSEWGWKSFRTGAKFQPFAPYRVEAVLRLLRSARVLPDEVVAALREKRDAAVSSWDGMHAGGRPALQDLLATRQADVPSPGDWMHSILDSEFAEDMIIQRVGASESDRPDLSRYVRWSPVCRAFLELALLMIRRHGVLHAVESSKYDPKWPDINHASFMPLVDYFVTDDTRLRRLLQEHRAARADATWEVMDLSAFSQQVHQPSSRRRLDVAPPLR